MVRSTGVVGLVTFVVLFAALIASSPGEPPSLARMIIICIQLVRKPGAVLRAADSRSEPMSE